MVNLNGLGNTYKFNFKSRIFELHFAITNRINYTALPAITNKC